MFAVFIVASVAREQCITVEKPKGFIYTAGIPHLPARLLDLLNGADLPSIWNGTDREILSAYVSALRRRTSGVRRASQVGVREQNGRSIVHEDGARIAVFEPDETRPVDRVGVVRKAVHYAYATAAALRARPSLPEWPSDQYAGELSAAGLGELENWRLEWFALQASALRRCGQPSCATPGGRFFKALRSQRDCDECRHAPRASKPTRWRHRQRTGE